jgi:hypothetical protein
MVSRSRVQCEPNPKNLVALNRMARAVGFEPTTNRLTADCSTAELRPNTRPGSGHREGAYLVSPARRVNTGNSVAPGPAHFTALSRRSDPV